MNLVNVGNLGFGPVVGWSRAVGWAVVLGWRGAGGKGPLTLGGCGAQTLVHWLVIFRCALARQALHYLRVLLHRAGLRAAIDDVQNGPRRWRNKARDCAVAVATSGIINGRARPAARALASSGGRAGRQLGRQRVASVFFWGGLFCLVSLLYFFFSPCARLLFARSSFCTPRGPVRAH